MSEEAKEIYYEFGTGTFRLYPVERVLRCEGAEIKLTNKRYDILLILLRCRERAVKNEELMEAIWAGDTVESSNLNVNISELRNALRCADPQASEFIKNYPRLGYRFMATVEERGVSMTVAILPFKLEGSQKVSDAIGQEMADTLTSMLNQNMSIRVTSSATVHRVYNEHPQQSPLTFGHRLVVDYVFSGRIWRERDRIHVNLDLLDVRADRVTASSSFEGDHTESFELDRLIHRWMGSVLRLTPTDREKEQSTKQYTKNRKANEYFKKGRIQRFDVTEPSLRRAIHYFEQATKEDPDFARAYASIADTFIMMGMLNLIAPEESYIGARDAARKAREKDENMASAHTAWAFTKLFFEWQWKESREGFARAIEINPNSPSAHMGYAHWLTAQGLFTDAVTEINQALALDPYNFFTNFVRGMVFFLARQYEQSLEQFERTHELNLRFNLKSDLSYYGSSLAYEYLALANEGEARERLFEKADAEARKSITRSQRHPLKLMQRIHLKTIWGKRDEALKMLDEVIESQQAGNYVSQYHLAIVYASFEEVDLAIKCLEEAYKVRDQYLFLLAVDPRLDSLRSDPRFKNLLSRLSIENRR
jgi:DNA-binding winged helix-turn-helix (wHTH) protein/tetratricopeptide (TPR) repeat protein